MDKNKFINLIKLMSNKGCPPARGIDCIGVSKEYCEKKCWITYFNDLIESGYLKFN